MPETWYVLEDGEVADPAEVTADKDGVLRHKDGTAVKMRDSGVPFSRGVDDPDQERERRKKKVTKEDNVPRVREIKPTPVRGTYNTR